MLTAYENQPVVQSNPYAWVTGVQNVNTGGVTPLYGTPSPYPTVLHYRARPMYAVDYMAPPVVQLDQTVGPNLDRIYNTLWDMMMRRPQPRASSGSTSSSGNTNSATQQEPAQAPAASPNITLDGVLLGRVQQAIADAMKNSTPVATAGPVIPAVSTSAADTTADVSVPWYGGNDPLMAAMTGSQTSGGFTISPEARAAYADIQAKQAERAARSQPYAETLVNLVSGAANDAANYTSDIAGNLRDASAEAIANLMWSTVENALTPSTSERRRFSNDPTGKFEHRSLPIILPPTPSVVQLPATPVVPDPVQVPDIQYDLPKLEEIAFPASPPAVEVSNIYSPTNNTNPQSFLDLLVNDPLGLYYMLQGTKEQ